MPLDPMVVLIGDVSIEHGERSHELDPLNPYACLCGVDDYLACEGWLFGGGIANLTVRRDDDGRVSVSRDEP